LALGTVRIYKIAELLDTSSPEIVALLKRDHGIDVKSASSTVEEMVARQFVERLAKKRGITLPGGDIFAEGAAAKIKKAAAGKKAEPPPPPPKPSLPPPRLVKTVKPAPVAPPEAEPAHEAPAAEVPPLEAPHAEPPAPAHVEAAAPAPAEPPAAAPAVEEPAAPAAHVEAPAAPARPVRQVAVDGLGGLAAERHQPLAATLAAHPQHALPQLQVGEVDADQLADP
jgi:hypothetical protein